MSPRWVTKRSFVERYLEHLIQSAGVGGEVAVGAYKERVVVLLDEHEGRRVHAFLVELVGHLDAVIHLRIGDQDAGNGHLFPHLFAGNQTQGQQDAQ